MGKKKFKRNKKSFFKRENSLLSFDLPEKIKRTIYGIIMFLTAIILFLSFFGQAGWGGEFLMNSAISLIGKAVFILPLLFFIAGLVFFGKKPEINYSKDNKLIIFAFILTVLGITGILETFAFSQQAVKEYGGFLGYLLASPLIGLFGIWGATIIFIAVIGIGSVIFYQSVPSNFWNPKPKKEEEKPIKQEKPLYSRMLEKVTGAPEFQIKQIDSDSEEDREGIQIEKKGFFDKKNKPEDLGIKTDTASIFDGSSYKFPPLDLLERDKGVAYSGDIRINSAIIKNTLENFNIPVEMSEINIGPTVTQYSLKPAEGIKLSKITTLSNDLALALAAHPIRIEAPIPGRSLVGIELPNKKRTIVGMRGLLEKPEFNDPSSRLTIALGKDVAGSPVYADLAKMPHLLIAGSTGSGKTISLNSIMLSLLYKSSPVFLRFILVDPKRVEFPVYNGLPHLLTPVIHTPQKTVDALRWLISEMERRFEVLSEAKARDIIGYNKIITENNNSKELKQEVMPYIVLVIDELADVMAARGRDVEAGIVRLSQMARAVGIHVIVATQRPSVEVITGLIKANITSRMTFQVASQIDSRTVLDMAGAEKLLGFGDMLYISTDISKPKRVQGAYISEKEVRKTVGYIKKFNTQEEPEEAKDKISEDLETALQFTEFSEADSFTEGEDLLYEQAKQIVIESKKASASLLQRRLRVGYARAARLIDMLEESGVVGPGDGAKPREIIAKDHPIESEPVEIDSSNDIPILPQEREYNEDNEDNENEEDNIV